MTAGCAHAILMAMSLAHTPQRISFEDFLAWSARQEHGRYEFIDGEVVPMPSEGGLHNLVKLAVAIALQNAVKAAGFQGTVFTDGMSVNVQGRNWREPDAVVTATPVADKAAMYLVDPLIVVEVVSQSSQRDDTSDKIDEYFSVPTIRHYLIVRPEKKLVIHMRRDDGGGLVTTLVTGSTLTLDPPGLALDLTPVFEVC